MAKKKLTTVAKAPKVKLSPRDAKTAERLTGLADRVVTAANNRKDPYVEIPSRTLANVKYSPKKKIIVFISMMARRISVGPQPASEIWNSPETQALTRE